MYMQIEKRFVTIEQDIGLVIIIKINFFSFYDPTVYNYFNFLELISGVLTAGPG